MELTSLSSAPESGPTVDPAHFGCGQPHVSANLESSIALGVFLGPSGGLGSSCLQRNQGEKNILKAMVEPMQGLL